jgi:hypothetical protein
MVSTAEEADVDAVVSRGALFFEDACVPCLTLKAETPFTGADSDVFDLKLSSNAAREYDPAEGEREKER